MELLHAHRRTDRLSNRKRCSGGIRTGLRRIGAVGGLGINAAANV
jgi:hypothetical protein